MNRKKIIVGGAGVLAVLIGAIIWANPSWHPHNPLNSAPLTANLRLTATENNFDFGTIAMSDGKISHDFIIKNNSSQPLTIKKLYTSCMCTTATLVKNSKEFGPFGMAGHGIIPEINQKLNASEEAVIKAIFNPAAHGPAGIGHIQRSIIIETDDQPLELTISALVTP